MDTPVLVQEWFDRSAKFAVVGAMSGSELLSNSVLRWYTGNKWTVVPVSTKEDNVEGLDTIPSLAALPGSPAEYRLSIIVPPSETKAVLEEAYDNGIERVWLEPGVDTPEALAYAEQVGLKVIAGEYSIMIEGIPYASS
ncbi:hypothetical protein BGW41_007079 [Actinomortierella wolfii]|nr:hypothetical protein BGW41_007079 [Actinomortierella wolfii]